MGAVLVPDTLWGLIEQLLPTPLPKPQGGRPAPDRPRLPRGHYLRATKRHSLADAAEKIGLRLRHDLLAAVARLAARRNLGFYPFRIAGLAFA